MLLSCWKIGESSLTRVRLHLIMRQRHNLSKTTFPFCPSFNLTSYWYIDLPNTWCCYETLLCLLLDSVWIIDWKIKVLFFVHFQNIWIEYSSEVNQFNKGLNTVKKFYTVKKSSSNPHPIFSKAGCNFQMFHLMYFPVLSFLAQVMSPVFG